MKRLVIDIETRSVADLPKVGVAVYANDPSTSITHVGYYNGHAKVWRPSVTPIPDDLYDALADERVTLVGHNFSFERTLLPSHAGEAIGIPPATASLSRWSCTAARATWVGIPRDLATVCRALRLSI